MNEFDLGGGWKFSERMNKLVKIKKNLEDNMCNSPPPQISIWTVALQQWIVTATPAVGRGS